MSEPPVDLIVVGAGPAGMEAALTAAAAGMAVALVDNQPQPGGQYFRQAPLPLRPPGSENGQAVAGQLLAHLHRAPIRLIAGATVWGGFPSDAETGWQVELLGAGVPPRLRAKSLVLATGAYDYPLPFRGWTLPGVMTAGAAQILVKTQGLRPGKRVLVTGSGPLQFAAAAALTEAGTGGASQVVGVLQAPFSLAKALRGLGQVWGQGKRLGEGLHYAVTLGGARVPVYWGWGVREVRGDGQVEEVEIIRLDRDWKPMVGSERVIAADTLVVGYGLQPNNHLARSLGCRHRFDPVSGAWLPQRDDTLQSSLPGVYIAGDAAEIHGAEAARLEGRLAGTAAAWRAGYLSAPEAERRMGVLRPALDRQQRFGRFLQELFAPTTGQLRAGLDLAGPETIVCRCEDVTLAEIRQAMAAGAGSPAEIKMMTRCGMGNCQGRMCETTVTHALLSADSDRVPAWEALSIRPPVVPVPICALTASPDPES